MEARLDGSAKAQAQATTTRIDLFTVAAIGVVAYLLSSITHEALGHGLAAILLGLHPQHVSSVDLDVSFAGVPDWKRQIVDAAGCGAQVVVALITLGIMPLFRVNKGTTRYFLWLFSTINLIIPGGYLMVLTFAGFGDWNDFVQGLPAQLAWRTGLTILGVIISLLGLYLGARNLDPFAGRATEGGNKRGKRRFMLTYTPYLAGSAALTISAIFNPVSPLLILISGAAASFGGTAFLMPINGIIKKPLPNTPEEPLTPTRDWLWLSLGVVALIIYFFVLGPGLPR
ncbi:hypothetical protein KSC_092520 [Ktedonobacter sp. SOSP1-52]|uniref:hypothetical protein n=1 Tax=Ktedonobacter sp. SOSP1-52 TaxID=2778366 RepID=UPI0019154DF4|nr:hypothetical protein [Ktedonobacter sp. SOSP1-52]GHO70360.1 hypothetical protein KSC_092520 [Ktedonobacter sp. SOSP1-52]